MRTFGQPPNRAARVGSTGANRAARPSRGQRRHSPMGCHAAIFTAVPLTVTIIMPFFSPSTS
jgi:hypothetical protein